MIADVWGVMAGPAKAGNALRSKHVIEPRNTCNVDLCTVENRLAAGDRCAIFVDAAGSGKAVPSLEKVEDVWRKLRACWILSEGIIDADKETGELSL
jgi:hypothetical protein